MNGGRVSQAEASGILLAAAHWTKMWKGFEIENAVQDFATGACAMQESLLTAVARGCPEFLKPLSTKAGDLICPLEC